MRVCCPGVLAGILLVMACHLLGGCEWREMTTEDTASKATTALPASQDSRLVAVRVETAPVLDGQNTDAAWEKAPAFVVPIDGYSGDSVTLKAVYTEQEIFLLVTWADYSHSVQQAGSWGRVHVGAQFGKASAEAVDRWERFSFEDMLSLLWNLDAADFTRQDALKPLLTPVGGPTSGGTIDRWLWAAGSTNPVHYLLDQYLDANGLRDDSGTSFAIPNTAMEDNPQTAMNEKAYPAFMPRADLTQRKIPKLFVVKGEKPILLYYRAEVEPFDLALVNREDTLPGVIFAEHPAGSVADVTGYAVHATEEETWTLEIRRALTTSTPGEDVQFSDLSASYTFAIAVFDNTDVDGSFSQVHTLTFAR